MSFKNSLNDDFRSRLSSSTWRPSAGPFDSMPKEATPNSLAAAASSKVQFSRAEYKEPPHSAQNSLTGYGSTPNSARITPNSMMATEASGRGRDRFRELKSYKERYQDVKEMSTSPNQSFNSKEARSHSADRRYSARYSHEGPRSRSSDRYTAARQRAELTPDECEDFEYERARKSQNHFADWYTERQKPLERSPKRLSKAHGRDSESWDKRNDKRRNIDPDGTRVTQTFSNRTDRWSPKESIYVDDDIYHRKSYQSRSSEGEGSPLFDEVDEEGAGHIQVGDSSPLSIGNYFDKSENSFKSDIRPRTPSISGTSRASTLGQSPRRSPGHSVSSKSSSKTKSTYADDLAAFTQGIAAAVIQNQGLAYDAECQSYDQEKRVRWGANALCGRFTRSMPPTTTKNKTKYVTFALLFTVLSIVAAVVALVYLENMNKRETAVPVAMPTPTPPTSIASPSDSTSTRFPSSTTFSSEISIQPTGQKEKFIGQYIETLSGGKSSSIGTPQFKARNWLLFGDDYDWSLQLSSAGDDLNSTEVTGRIRQRFALATMYYSMGVGDGGVLKGWLEGDECRFVGNYGRAWDGIDCNEDGKVRAIALDAANLQGSIPPEISLLTDLENLIIKNNPNLVGEIPHEIGNSMSRLRQLGLYNNNLGGSIPKSIFKLSQLVYLNLAGNALRGEVNWEEISHYQKKLERLILHNNFLEGSVEFHLLAKSPLLLLVLSNNQFGGYIDETLGSMTSLEYLYLNKNELIGSIPDGIGNLVNIKSINFDENKLYGTLPITFGNLVTLEHFSAKKNTLSGGFPDSMKLLHNLQTLNLARNAMTGHLSDLPHMKGLKNLHLYQNGFVGTIPQALFELSNLEVLFLSSNLLTGEIPLAVNGAQQTLKSLYLSDNKLRGHVPHELCDLYKLEDLFIDTNDLDGLLPTCLGSLSNLKRLYAFKNRLNGDIPSGLLELPHLIEVGIEENNLTGGVDKACEWVRGIKIWADCNELGGCECCERCCSDLGSGC